MTIPNNAKNLESIQINYPQISTALLILFCGYVVIWYLQMGVRVPALGAIRFEMIYAAFLTFAALNFTPKHDIQYPILKYVILYFLVLIIQVPFSYHFEMSWNVFIDRIIKFSFMSFFIVSFVRSPRDMKFFLAAFLLCCLKMGQEGYLGRISGALIWENQEVMRLHGSTPNYQDPNSFAGMALGTLPFVYYLWPLTNKYIKSILLLIAFLSFHIVLYSGSRTGYIGVFAFIFYIFIISKNKKSLLIILLLFTLMIYPIIPAQYVGRFNSIFDTGEKAGGSTKARKEILRDATAIFIENPFGIGIAAFPKKRNDTFDRRQDTHNLYLEIATNLGIQGLIIVGLLIYKMLKTLNIIRTTAGKFVNNLLHCTVNTTKSLVDDLLIIEAVASATSAFIVIRLALGLFGMDLYEIYWWFAIGITMSLYSMIQKIKPTLERDPALNSSGFAGSTLLR